MTEETEEHEYHKLPQDVAVYVETDPEGNYWCKDCMMFIPDRNECTAVEGFISPKGSSAFWMKGKKATVDQINPHRFSQMNSLYEVQPNGFSCKRCRHFLEKEGACIRVQGKIKPNGCCNGWEEKLVGREELMVSMMKG